MATSSADAVDFRDFSRRVVIVRPGLSPFGVLLAGSGSVAQVRPVSARICDTSSTTSLLLLRAVFVVVLAGVLLVVVVLWQFPLVVVVVVLPSSAASTSSSVGGAVDFVVGAFVSAATAAALLLSESCVSDQAEIETGTRLESVRGEDDWWIVGGG